MNKTHAVIKRPGQPAAIELVDTSLDGINTIVEGMSGTAMRARAFFPDGRDLVVHCNDDGLALGLPPNLFRPSDGAPVVGVAIATKVDRDGYALPMTEADAAAALALIAGMEAV